MPDSAKAILEKYLAAYGLESLGAWAWEQYTAGSSVEEIMLAIRERPEYIARFPAMAALAAAGNAITETEYISYEKSVRELLQNFGIPAGMYDTPEGIAGLLVNNVSASEVSERLRIAASAVYTAPAEVRQSLTEMLNLSPGDLVGYYLDPDKAAPILQQTYQAAQVMGAGKQQKVMIDEAEARRLARNGVTYEQAVSGFGDVAATAALAGGPGENIDQMERIRAIFGEAAERAKMTRVQRSRTAAFSGGGNAAETQEGVSGLGGASTR